MSMKNVLHLIAGLLLALAVSSPVLAVNPDEMLKDPVLEKRAEALGQQLRCLVCQGQSIENSDADLARDLRIIVRERIKAGDSDQKATQYIVDRYGEFVLLKPVFALHTLLLWIGAPAVLLLGLIWLIVRARRTPPVPERAEDMTADEAAALDRLQTGQ